MEHGVYRDLIPAYAIGATDANEASELEKHLDRCPECRDLLAEYRALGDVLLWSPPPLEAPPALGRRLEQRVRAGNRTDRPRAWWANWRVPALGGLATALLLLLATNIYWYGRTTRVEQQVTAQSTAIAALAEAPTVELKSPSAESKARGVLYYHATSEIAVLHTYDLPPLEQGKTYQLWLTRNGARDSGGLFQVNDEGEGILLIHASYPLKDYQGVGITVEPAGGSKAPTTPRVLGGTL